MVKNPKYTNRANSRTIHEIEHHNEKFTIANCSKKYLTAAPEIEQAQKEEKGIRSLKKNKQMDK